MWTVFLYSKFLELIKYSIFATPRSSYFNQSPFVHIVIERDYEWMVGEVVRSRMMNEILYAGEQEYFIAELEWSGNDVPELMMMFYSQSLLYRTLNSQILTIRYNKLKG